MKILVDNEEIFELTETQKKVIKNDIPEEIFEEDMARRCKYWCEIPCQKHCHVNREKMTKEAKDKGFSKIPTDMVKLGAMLIDDTKDYTPLKCKCGNVNFEIPEESQKIFNNIRGNDSYAERIKWVLTHKYERCLERLKLEWIPRLEAKGITEIPSDDDEFAELVFNQSDYKSRSQREADSE